MMRLLALLLFMPCLLMGQAWSTFLDSSRAIDWTSAGAFTIPSYTVNCSTQPTLTANSTGAAAANATAIINALASCDATHNVVNIPAGTYYVNGFYFGAQGNQVLRGAGPNNTYIFSMSTAQFPNGGFSWAVDMAAQVSGYFQHSSVLPGGTNLCSWTGTNGTVGTYTQGATSIILDSCGSTPPASGVIHLDQVDDVNDTNGIFICNGDQTPNICAFNGPGNEVARVFPGNIVHSQQQSTFATLVSGTGTGPFTYTISPGVYFNNIRSSQNPGMWWTGTVTHDGIENLTIDYSQNSVRGSSLEGIVMMNCYQCWVKGIRSISGGRNHIAPYESLQDIVRDSYFYQAQTPGTSQSYGIEFGHGSSACLVENNIFQQLTVPLMGSGVTGSVWTYNYSINNQQSGSIMQSSYYAHTPGVEMDLWEGNNLNAAKGDSTTFGASPLGSFFRNNFVGWQSGKVQYTSAFVPESWSRAFNFVGNVIGQPGFHTNYEAYATSNTGGVNAGLVDVSVYVLGFNGLSGNGNCAVTPPACSALVRSTLMRWGNYDTVTPGINWNSTEAAPAAVPFVNANFTTTYFNTLAHTLPNSLYYSSKPSWWSGSVAWPPIGPDITTGNIGMCSGGTFDKSQALSSSQCTGGSLVTAWGSHVNAIPAQVCYLNVMNGPPDGSGSVLPFDATACATKWAPGPSGRDYINGGPNGRNYSNGINGANGRKYP